MATDDSLKRRSFLKAAGGATAAATLAGCTGGGGEGDGTTTGTTETTSGTTEGGETDTTTTEESGSSGGTLTYARGADSGTLDFQNTTSGEVAKVTNQIYDSLIEFKPGKTSLKAGLATKWNVDGKTVSLTLREGVKFHNGDEFTAKDFVATYRRFVDEDYEHYPGKDYVSSYGPYSLGSWIKSVKKDGKYGVSITLKQQYAPILANLAMFCSKVHSLKAIKKYGTDLKSNPVGTGPFKFENWDQGNQRIRLSKNEEFWGEQNAKVGEVVFTAVGKNSTRAQTLVSGGADIVDGLGAQSSKIIEGSNKAELVSMPGINVGYMAFNMARVEAFRNKKVRQAISYAIDTKSLVNTIFKGIASQASQPIPESVMGYNPDLDPYGYKPDKAKKMLKEAGYDGLSFELSIMKNPRPYLPSPRQAAQLIKSNLGDVGVTVELNTMPWKAYLTYTENYKHDACFLGWMTDNGDPDNFYYALLHPGISRDAVPEGQDWADPSKHDNFNTLDVAAWANTEFMKLTEEAQTSYKTSERKPKYQQAGKIFHEEQPWVALDHTKTMRGVAKRVSGFEIAPIGGPFLKQVSLEK
ncbi:ABC transporter substrate-binding protein [Halorussus gelatinilyticus]|uniref:ABC transporter substrate-binding protein n=1 Tax=Halorussus gelatinilyticus TaxID=2937524 RepID=A0A8U0INV1_9EURY|nr:ABC transporter substrate-binding protein [Halorussus gelatinilyticus]UPW02142.1 ABC transporter substrate-binding protein [Halorussus gelatinilyticus]